MRLLLQLPSEHLEAVRFFQLNLEQDLLGGWRLSRESGTYGGRIQHKHELFLQRSDAMLAFARYRDAQLKRGYLVIASHAEPTPTGD